jgi:hypothetical protein
MTDSWVVSSGERAIEAKSYKRKQQAKVEAGS